MKEDSWLLGIMHRCNVPDPSVKPPKGDKLDWKDTSKWTLMSRGKKFTTVNKEYVATRREDIVDKACQRITVVKAEIACFIDDESTWTEWTAPLRAARRAVSQIRNQLTQLMLANDKADDLFGEGAKLSESQLNSYKRAGAIQEAIAEKAAEELPALEQEEEKLAKKAQRAKSKATREAYNRKLADVRNKVLGKRADAQLKLAGGTKSSVARSAVQAYKDWKMKRSEKDVPNMRPNQPIPLRAGSSSPEWDIEASNKGYKVTFLVCSNYGRQHASIKLSGGSNHATIRKYLEGKATRRDAKLFYDERRKRWVIAMTFGIPRADLVEGDGVAAIRIGVANFISILDNQGRFRDLETYHKSAYEMQSHQAYIRRQRIIPRKLEFKQLKSDARKDRNFQGIGARGHGKDRFYRIYKRHKDAERRFVKTWMGQIGAAAVKHCVAHGIGKVYIAQMTTAVPDYILENYMEDRVAWLIKRFPFCTLRDTVIQALDKAGIEVIIVSDDRDCDTCPSCGHVDKMNHNPRRRIFVCVECNMRHAADLTAAWNYLRKQDVDCSGIQRMSDHKQEWYKKAFEKTKRIEEADEEFERAHKGPEAAE